MSKFKVGDFVKPKDGHYTDFTTGSYYNLPRHPMRVVQTGHHYIVVEVRDGLISPAVNPESFDRAEPTGPIRTVTRREIVPGTYGILEVGAQLQPDRANFRVISTNHSAEQLREASHLLAQLAEVLEESAKEAA